MPDSAIVVHSGVMGSGCARSSRRSRSRTRPTRTTTTTASTQPTARKNGLPGRAAKRGLIDVHVTARRHGWIEMREGALAAGATESAAAVGARDNGCEGGRQGGRVALLDEKSRNPVLHYVD